MDILIRVGEPRPQPGKRLLARHPFDAKKRAYVTPSVVIPLLRLVFKGAAAAVSAEEYPLYALAEGASEDLKRCGAAGSGPVGAGVGAGGGAGGGSSAAALSGALRAPSPTLPQLRDFVKAQMKLFRTDILRPLNPTPYKVSTSPELFHFLHDLLMVRLYPFEPPPPSVLRARTPCRLAAASHNTAHARSLVHSFPPPHLCRKSSLFRSWNNPRGRWACAYAA